MGIRLRFPTVCAAACCAVSTFLAHREHGLWETGSIAKHANCAAFADAFFDELCRISKGGTPLKFEPIASYFFEGDDDSDGESDQGSAA
jgi:hypothetical protein